MKDINRRDFIKLAASIVVAPAILTEVVKTKHYHDNHVWDDIAESYFPNRTGKYTNIKTTARTPLYFDEDELIKILNSMPE